MQVLYRLGLLILPKIKEIWKVVRKISPEQSHSVGGGGGGGRGGVRTGTKTSGPHPDDDWR